MHKWRSRAIRELIQKYPVNYRREEPYTKRIRITITEIERKERKMTIQEAIRSRKPFTRKSWLNKDPIAWYLNKSDNNKIRNLSDGCSLFGLETLQLRWVDILATDWEVKP